MPLTLQSSLSLSGTLFPSLVTLSPSFSPHLFSPLPVSSLSNDPDLIGFGLRFLPRLTAATVTKAAGVKTATNMAVAPGATATTETDHSFGLAGLLCLHFVLSSIRAADRPARPTSMMDETVATKVSV